ncbi:transposase [Streptomyces sp. NPDC059456]|uniref:transposase n=1 Tax=Streptomyces sp. NPDC059456 TaxID=3346838 RepID=UPI00368775CC
MIADGAYLGTGLVVPHRRRASRPLLRDQDPIRRRTTPNADAGHPDRLRRRLRRRAWPNSSPPSADPAQAGLERWVVERTMSWLAGCCRLHRRYERKAEHFLAFVGVAAVLICRRLTK